MKNANCSREHTTIINTHAGLYVHNLTLYRDVPRTEIKLTEFEELAIGRMRLFRIIEQASSKGHQLFSDDWLKCIENTLLNNKLKGYVRLMGGAYEQTEFDIQARRADHISHYILRLTYCRKRDLQKWFIARELEWFRIKFITQSSAAILKFLELNHLKYSPISHNYKESIKNELAESTSHQTDVEVKNDFYKVPFTDVLPLVKDQEVFVKDGYAYVPLEGLVFSVLHKFQYELAKHLSRINENLPKLEDDRLKDILLNLLGPYSGNGFIVDTSEDEIDLADIDELSKKHFPLCMRHLHETLRAKHHLKNSGRQIYGLFLKSIGLQYHQFIQFWRNEFTQIMDNDKFDKKYLYQFNHQCGKVGRMVDYDPYSCMGIIMGNVNAGEVPGCPFKHFDPSVFAKKLNQYGVNKEAITDIMTLGDNAQYQAACTKYFQYTHYQPPTSDINHPNQYFEESRALALDESLSDESES